MCKREQQAHDARRRNILKAFNDLSKSDRASTSASTSKASRKGKRSTKQQPSCSTYSPAALPSTTELTEILESEYDNLMDMPQSDDEDSPAIPVDTQAARTWLRLIPFMARPHKPDHSLVTKIYGIWSTIREDLVHEQSRRMQVAVNRRELLALVPRNNPLHERYNDPTPVSLAGTGSTELPRDDMLPDESAQTSAASTTASANKDGMSPGSSAAQADELQQDSSADTTRVSEDNPSSATSLAIEKQDIVTSSESLEDISAATTTDTTDATQECQIKNSRQQLVTNCAQQAELDFKAPRSMSAGTPQTLEATKPASRSQAKSARKRQLKKERAAAERRDAEFLSATALAIQEQGLRDLSDLLEELQNYGISDASPEMHKRLVESSDEAHAVKVICCVRSGGIEQLENFVGCFDKFERLKDIGRFKAELFEAYGSTHMLHVDMVITSLQGLSYHRSGLTLPRVGGWEWSRIRGFALEGVRTVFTLWWWVNKADPERGILRPLMVQLESLTSTPIRDDIWHRIKVEVMLLQELHQHRATDELSLSVMNLVLMSIGMTIRENIQLEELGLEAPSERHSVEDLDMDMLGLWIKIARTVGFHETSLLDLLTGKRRNGRALLCWLPKVPMQITKACENTPKVPWARLREDDAIRSVVVKWQKEKRAELKDSAEDLKRLYVGVEPLGRMA